MSLLLPESEWVSDTNVSSCMGCGSVFNFLNRRHHCRRCGGVFCSSCSAHRLRLDKRSTEAQRVCDNCFQNLTSLPAGGGNGGGIDSDERSAARAVQASSRQSVHQQSTVHKKATQAASSPPDTPTSFQGDSVSISSTNSLLTPSSTPSTERILYETLTICSRCSFLEKRGFDWQPAVVFEKNKRVYIRCLCQIHNQKYSKQKVIESKENNNNISNGDDWPTTTMSEDLSSMTDNLVMSNSSFFLRLCSFDPLLLDRIQRAANPVSSPSSSSSSAAAGAIVDIEDLAKLISHSTSFSSLNPSATPKFLPLFFDVSVWENDKFVNDEIIHQKILQFRASIPETSRFVLRIHGGLPERHQIKVLNEKLLRVVQLTAKTPLTANNSSNNSSSASASSTPAPSTATSLQLCALSGCPILIDLPYERLVDLLALPDSIFLKARVYPELRYYLAAGEESQNAHELHKVIDAVKTIRDLHFVLTVHIEASAKMPDLTKLLDLFQKHTSLVRYLLFVVERSPKQVINKMLGKDSSADDVTDAFTLVEELDRATQGKIKHRDLFPARYATLLAPFIAYFGGGEFHLNASPLCAFGAAIINTAENKFVALSRLFDIPKLYERLAPIANRIRKGDEQFSLSMLKAIQKSLKESALTNSVPKLSDYASQEGAAAESVQNFMKNLQFIVIHNKMDFGDLDGHRRVGCAHLMTSPIQGDKYVASCSGCV